MTAVDQPDLRISYVAYQPHVVITNTQVLGQCLILRIPEYVRDPASGKGTCPGGVVWTEVERETRLRYRWGAPDETKAAFETDFWGEVEAVGDGVKFAVTMKRLGQNTHDAGVSLFCLQAGGAGQFHDYDGTRTFVRQGEAWRSVNDMIDGQFLPHRMCGFKCTATTPAADEVTARLMVKVSADQGWVLGIILDACRNVSCNHQLWPSCIHANPAWDDLAPGEEQTVHGKLYYLRGSLDELLAAYRRDFGED